MVINAFTCLKNAKILLDRSLVQLARKVQFLTICVDQLAKTCAKRVKNNVNTPIL